MKRPEQMGKQLDGSLEIWDPIKIFRDIKGHDKKTPRYLLREENQI